MRRFIILIATLILLAGALVTSGCGSEKTAEETAPAATAPATTPAAQPFAQQTFENVKSAHYVSSDPDNNQLLTSPPAAVTIFFNFNLGTENTISVTREGMPVATGPLTVAPDKLSMSIPIDASTTGNYRVDYIASWPDRSRHSGMFGFSVKLP